MEITMMFILQKKIKQLECIQEYNKNVLEIINNGFPIEKTISRFMYDIKEDDTKEQIKEKVTKIISDKQQKIEALKRKLIKLQQC